MTVVKTIRAVFIADTGDFVTDVKKAENASENFSKQAKSTAAGVDGLSKSVGGIGDTFKQLLALGVIAKIGAELVNFGKYALNSAVDVGEMQSKFDVVFRDLAGNVGKELDVLGESINRSKYDLMGYAATFQDTFVPLGFARDQAAAMSVQLVKLAEDLASFNNLNTADVARDLQSALVGNTETVRKYGVVATETAIKARALELGLWDGTGAMDAQTKAATILNIILASTADAQGDAARTAQSAANLEKGLAAAYQEVAVAVGQKAAPAYADLLGRLTEVLNLTAQSVSFIDDYQALQVELANTSSSYDDYMQAAMDAALQNMQLSQTQYDYMQMIIETDSVLPQHIDYMEYTTEQADILTEAEYNNAAATATMREQYERQRDVFGEVASAADDVAESVAGITFELKELSATQIASQVVSDLNKALADGKISQEDYADAMITVGDEILDLPPDVIAANLAMAGLRKEFEDGDLSLFSYIDKANQLADVMAELDGTEASVRVIFTITGADALENLGVTAGDIGINPHDIPATPDAMGSRVYPGEARLVGEGGRPEVFIPDVSGHIEPLTSSNAPGGNTYVYNAYSEGAAALAMAQIEQARSSRLNSRM